MKSEIIEADWWTSTFGTMGAVLTWNEIDGFKVRIGIALNRKEDIDRQVIAENGAKVTFPHAIGIFGSRMKTENIHRHLKEKNVGKIIKYDGREYVVADMGIVG